MNAQPPDRQARRRQETRSRLLRSARRLFATQGAEGTAISEITEGADVGFGSFYNYFSSKDEIVEVLLADDVAAQGATVDWLTEKLEDPAEIVAVAHRYFAHLARSDPDWAWLMVRLDASRPIMAAALGPWASRDLQRGIAVGRFHVPDEATALAASGGALRAVMRGILEGHLPADAEQHHAAGVLRLFGLDADDALAVAARPMPAAQDDSRPAIA